MSAPELAQLRNLCGKQETITRAQRLLQSAKSRTAPGSGFEIREAKAGLPAICALLASHILQNDDVKETVAQKASCLAAREFKRTLETVRLALHADELAPASPSKKRVGNVPQAPFHSLCERYGVAESARIGMLEALREFKQSPLSKPFEAGGTAVERAIFQWVCAIIKHPDVATYELLSDTNVSHTRFSEIKRIVNQACVNAVPTITRAAAAETRSPTRPARSSTASPTKRLAQLATPTSADRFSRQRVVSRAKLEHLQTPKKPASLDADERALDPCVPSPALSADSPSSPTRQGPVTRSCAPFIGLTPIPASNKRKLSLSLFEERPSPSKKPYQPLSPSKLRQVTTPLKNLESLASDWSDENDDASATSIVQQSASPGRGSTRAPSTASSQDSPRLYVGQNPASFLKMAAETRSGVGQPKRQPSPTPVRSSPRLRSAAVQAAQPLTPPSTKGTKQRRPALWQARERLPSESPTKHARRAAARPVFAESDDDDVVDADDELKESPLKLAVRAGRLRTYGARGATNFMRGRNAASAVFRDRQAYHQPDPLVARRLAAWAEIKRGLDLGLMEIDDAAEKVGCEVSAGR